MEKIEEQLQDIKEIVLPSEMTLDECIKATKTLAEVVNKLTGTMAAIAEIVKTQDKVLEQAVKSRR